MIFKKLFLFLILVSGLTGTLWANPAGFSPGPDSLTTKTLSVADMLNPDGSLNLYGRRGQVDLTGWNVNLDAGGSPMLVPADGEWSALGSGMDDNTVSSLAFDGDGHLYAGGLFTTAGGVTVNYIAKWDGSSWSALGSGMNGDVYSLAVDSDGNLYAGGQFTTAGGVPVNYIAKWDGSSWSALGSGIDSVVLSVAVDGDGNLYAGGIFNTAGGVPANRIAKWDGSSWSALGSGMDYWVLAFAVDGDGNLFAGGDFTTAGGVETNYIAKWDGSSWSALGSGMNNSVYSLAVGGDGHLYVGGFFSTASAVPASKIAKWDGSSWSALGSGTNSNVYSLAFDSDGHLYAGGDFTSAGGVAANRVAKWDGASWSALGSGMNTTIISLAVDVDGNPYAGGAFTMAGGVPANYIATWRAGSPDADGDGVNDDVDLCTETASGDAVDANGCSDAQVDGDGDGVCDPGAASGGPSMCTGTDNCPDVANAGQEDYDGDGTGYACDAHVVLNDVLGFLVTKVQQAPIGRFLKQFLLGQLSRAADALTGNVNAWHRDALYGDGGSALATSVLRSFIFIVEGSRLSGDLKADWTGHAGVLITLLGGENKQAGSWAKAEGIPSTYVLDANYPNPFNPETNLRFGLPETAYVTLTVFDIQGKEVATLVEGVREAGWYTASFDAGELRSGVYLYRLVTPARVLSGAMSLVR